MKGKRPLYIILISLLIVIAVVIFLLPTFFSSKAGTEFLIRRIEKKSNARLKIDSFHLTWFGPQKIKTLSYKDPNFDIDADSIISNMSLLSFYKSIKSLDNLKFFANTEINNLNIALHFPNMAEANFYNVHATIKGDIKKINSIHITGKTSAENNTGDFRATIDILGQNIKASVKGKNIPTIGLDQLLFYNNEKYKNSLVQVLGNSIDLNITSTLDDLKGPIDIDFHSPGSRGSLNLFYQKNQITLTQNAIIVLQVAGMNPKFINQISYLQSQPNYPVIIKVSADGFLFPLPFKIQNFKVRHMSVDLNKMIISNTGVIRTITSLAKMRSSNTVGLWFNTVNIQIDQGMLFSDRLDFLINDFVHLCLWGKTNLVNRTLRMNLGVTSDTLYSIFGIQNLPSDYVIKIPIKGSFEKPKIDAAGASAKILALSAFQSGEGLGAIIGGVISQFQKDKHIPPPKKPFPWEGKVRTRQESNQQGNIFDFFK